MRPVGRTRARRANEFIQKNPTCRPPGLACRYTGDESPGRGHGARLWTADARLRMTGLHNQMSLPARRAPAQRATCCPPLPYYGDSTSRSPDGWTLGGPTMRTHSRGRQGRRTVVRIYERRHRDLRARDVALLASLLASLRATLMESQIHQHSATPPLPCLRSVMNESEGVRSADHHRVNPHP